MSPWWVFLLLNPCWGCTYEMWSNSVKCFGPNTTQLPSLNDSDWVYHVDVVNTAIRDISILCRWKRLRFADIRQNLYLPCSHVLHVQKSCPIFDLLTDCDDVVKTPAMAKTIYRESCEQWWIQAVSLLTTALTLALCLYFKLNMPKRNKPEHEESVELGRIPA